MYRLTWKLCNEMHERIFSSRWAALDFKWRQQRLFGIRSKFEEWQ